MSTATVTPKWPADPEHREAIDTLLVMAEAEDRWGEQRWALELLENVEQIRTSGFAAAAAVVARKPRAIKCRQESRVQFQDALVTATCRSG